MTGHVQILNAPPAKPSSSSTSPCGEGCQRRSQSHHMKQAGLTTDGIRKHPQVARKAPS